MLNPKTNLEVAFEVLEVHRLGGHWTSESVAADLLYKLGLEPSADVMTHLKTDEAKP